MRRKAGGNADPIPMEDEQMPAYDEPVPDAVGNDEPGIDLASVGDIWALNSDVIIRHHRVPRTKLFSLHEEGISVPIPVRYVDVMRRTEMDLDDPS